MIAPLSTHQVKNRAFFFVGKIYVFFVFLSGPECRQRYHQDIIIPVGKSRGSHDYHEIRKMQRGLTENSQTGFNHVINQAWNILHAELN